LEVKVDRKRVIPSVAGERFRDERSGHKLVGTVRNNELQVDLALPDGRKFDLLALPMDRPFIHKLAYSIGTNVKQEFYTQSVDLQMDVFTWVNSNLRMRFFEWYLDAIRQPSLPGQDVLSDNGRNLSSVLYSI